MLADFGIALAVKEAGGNRLTQTGLSLGTPQYMSPEQATGDRGIDARSDVYSLAAVLYEMLAGEPPVTGASAQSMIAKLMTEQADAPARAARHECPRRWMRRSRKRWRRRRPIGSRVPGDFARALDAKPTGSNTASNVASAAPRSRQRVDHGWCRRGRARDRRRSPACPREGSRKAEGHATLGNKTQLTSTGERARSRDLARRQAARVRSRVTVPPASARFSIVVQDVGGTTTRTILEGATAGYGLEWSPDRRNLALHRNHRRTRGHVTRSRRSAEHRAISTARVRDVLSPAATHCCLARSTILIRSTTFAWRRWTASLATAFASPAQGRRCGPSPSCRARNWIVTLIIQAPHGFWQVIDRSGKVTDHVVNACTCGGIATRDAVWLARAGDGSGEVGRAHRHRSARWPPVATRRIPWPSACSRTSRSRAMGGTWSWMTVRSITACRRSTWPT